MPLSPPDATDKTVTVTNDRGGLIDAQVNYYLTKLAAEDDGNTIAVPEYNLEIGGAGCAMTAYLRGRTIESSLAFELGLEIANIIQSEPFHAGPRIRAAIERAVRESAVA
jgi:hypothetical protein